MLIWTGKKYYWINGCPELVNNTRSSAYVTSTYTTSYEHKFTMVSSSGINCLSQYEL